MHSGRITISRFVGNKAYPYRGSCPSGRESAFQKADGKRQGRCPWTPYCCPERLCQEASSGVVVAASCSCWTGKREYPGRGRWSGRNGPQCLRSPPRRVPLPQKRNEIKSFFPEIAFSGKIPLAQSNSPGDCLIRFDTKSLDLERASKASAMSGAHPLTFQSPAKRV